MLYKIIFMVFAAAFFSTIAVYVMYGHRLSTSNRIIKRRLEGLAAGADAIESFQLPVLRDDRLSQIPFLNRALSRLFFIDRLRLLIVQSGVGVNCGTVILGASSLAGLLLLVVLQTTGNIIPSVLAAGLASFVPFAYLRYKKRKRVDEFEGLLPEALDMVTNALKSGFSFEVALRMAGQEIPDPLGVEFALTFQEQNLGVNFSDALMNLRRRMPSDDLNLFITALIVHKKTGGNLAEILDKTASTIRDRFRLKREIKTKTAHGRFSGLVLVLMPMMMILVIMTLNPGYFMTLLDEQVGNYMLEAAVAMQIAGIWLIKRIVNVKI